MDYKAYGLDVEEDEVRHHLYMIFSDVEIINSRLNRVLMKEDQELIVKVHDGLDGKELKDAIKALARKRVDAFMDFSATRRTLYLRTQFQDYSSMVAWLAAVFAGQLVSWYAKDKSQYESRYGHIPITDVTISSGIIYLPAPFNLGVAVSNVKDTEDAGVCFVVATDNGYDVAVPSSVAHRLQVVT